MPEDVSTRVDRLAQQVRSLRRRPLFVFYHYEGAGRVSEDDVEDVYDEFRRRNWASEQPGEKLDVLIHSYGGDPDHAYRIAQVIRNFASDVVFLVPFHATSAATLITLCGNRIRVGPYAFLGPIDVEMGDVELAAIDSFREFAVNARREVEEVLDEGDSKRTTDVESVLLRELVNQEKAFEHWFTSESK